MKQLFTAFLALCSATASFSQANTKLSNLVSPTAVNQHLLPNTTNARDLGSSSYAWRNLYLRGYVYLDGTRFLSNAPGTGAYNAFVGSNAGVAVTSGKNNSVLGHSALNKTTSGYSNSAVGAYALYNNTTGYSNIALGTRSLFSNTTGYWNIAVGDSALYSNTTGVANQALGYRALYGNTGGSSNNAFGFSALASNTTGSNNVVMGYYAAVLNASGQGNVAIGYHAMPDNVDGFSNVAVGSEALLHTVSSYNTGVGQYAGYYNSSFGTFVGAYAYPYPAGQTNVTAIGHNARTTASNQVRIGDYNVTSIGGQVNWTALSDGRYKLNIKQDVHGLDFINSLRPITYTVDVKGLNAYYGKGRKQPESGAVDEKQNSEQAQAEAEASKIIYNGFVAQEVELAAQKLNYAFSGVDKPQSREGLYGLRYSDFVVPLVKAVQELSEKDKEIDLLKEQLVNQQEQITELRKIVLDLRGGTGSVTFNAAYLEQNTPNPAGGTTIIRYHIPEITSVARLELTNTKGQLFKSISIRSSATGQITLNTAMLAAGTYNYTLYLDGKQVDTKRLLIAR